MSIPKTYPSRQLLLKPIYWLLICQILPLYQCSVVVNAFTNTYCNIQKFCIKSQSSKLKNDKACSQKRYLRQPVRSLQSKQYSASYKTTVCKSTTSSDDTSSTPTSTATQRLSITDIQHMKQATNLAKNGYGNTYPNPAVGCILVRHDNNDNADEDVILGSGFHPKAGMPHAEVFALLEACGHVDDGVVAAKSVMHSLDEHDDGDESTIAMSKQVVDLLDTYKSDNGASILFENNKIDSNWNVTAYVTLEPCCHTGQTPPCASSLVKAGVNRVVVGYRDPNPRVDGGGIQVLEDAGVDVCVLSQVRRSGAREEISAAEDCSNIIRYFVKRISPRDKDEPKLEDTINGAKRRILRSIAGRKKNDNTIQQLDFPRDHSISQDDKENSDFAKDVPICHRFLERIDAALWDHELVILRLSNVVKKKKGAKIIGERIAEELDAHLAQVIGHTALLYRPGYPPVLDLDALLIEDKDNE